VPRYEAYLLRVWRGEMGDSGRWACRLEHLPDGEYQRFGSLEELLIGLRYLLADERAGSPAPNTPQAHEPAAQE
jgi:hypothetical protein